MSDKSNLNGRAFEYACIIRFYNELRRLRKTEIIVNDCFREAKREYLRTDEETMINLEKSAATAAAVLFDTEPLMTEDDKDTLYLYIQQDKKGEEGDVRDIVIKRDEIQWEIGLSVKHNHFAVKHSRLSPSIDFGEKWFGVKCSEEYWDDIKPVFEYLKEEEAKGTLFRELPDKSNDVYIPILKAFVKEIKKSYEVDNLIVSRMVEYLLGKYDFYKVIAIDSKRLSRIQSYNLKGTLNQKGRTKEPIIILPIAELPTELWHLDFKTGSDTTVEMGMNNGWQFSFRIHNAEEYVKQTLKFDIQIVGMPTTIITIDRHWID